MKYALPFGTFLALGAAVAAVAGEDTPLVSRVLPSRPCRDARRLAVLGLTAIIAAARRRARLRGDAPHRGLAGGAPLAARRRHGDGAALGRAAGCGDAAETAGAGEHARAVASERLSAQIVDSLTSGLLLVSADATVQIVNPAAGRMLRLADRSLPAPLARCWPAFPGWRRSSATSWPARRRPTAGCSPWVPASARRTSA